MTAIQRASPTHQPSHNRRVHIYHTGDSPGVSGSGSQEALPYWAPHDAYYKRPLPSRPGDRVDLPNTYNKHSDSDKMRRQRNKFQMKEKDKMPEKELHEMEISNIPDK